MTKLSSEHIGNRLLLAQEPRGYRDYPQEAIVLEISANGFVKLRWPMTRAEVWYSKDHWGVLEVLS